MAGEILNINNEYKHYKDYKAAVDEELKRSAESFVRIGYLLKIAMDTDILKESGYRDVNEFAQLEYDLDKSQVSRFIRINNVFSEGGYSDRLKEKYRGFGHAKLSIMLMLPEYVNEELSPDLSKTDILAVKEEVEAEQKISDLEVLMEEKDERQQSYGIFAKVLHQLGKEKPELYLALYDAVGNTAYEGTKRPVVVKLVNALAPMGEALHSVRIAGEGRKLLSIKGEDIDPVITDIRTGEKTSCSWEDFITDMESLCGEQEAKASWEKLYGGSFPEEEKKEDPVQGARKQSKVHKAKEIKKEERTNGRQEKEETTDSQTDETAGNSTKETGIKYENALQAAEIQADPEAQQKEEGEKGIENTGAEQLPQQMNIEQFPEYLPENYDVAPVQPKMQGILVKESLCLGELKEELNSVYVMTDKREYAQARDYLKKAGDLLDRIEQLMRTEGQHGEEETP